MFVRYGASRITPLTPGLGHVECEDAERLSMMLRLVLCQIQKDGLEIHYSALTLAY